jgi:hypothetical protein
LNLHEGEVVVARAAIVPVEQIDAVLALLRRSKEVSPASVEALMDLLLVIQQKTRVYLDVFEGFRCTLQPAVD